MLMTGTGELALMFHFNALHEEGRPQDGDGGGRDGAGETIDDG
jgi:hypothetical protein